MITVSVRTLSSKSTSSRNLFATISRASSGHAYQEHQIKSIISSEANSDLEPVDGAAVDERWEHAQSVSKRVSNWTHSQNNVQRLLHAINEEVVHCQRRCVHLLTLRCKSQTKDLVKRSRGWPAKGRACGGGK